VFGLERLLQRRAVILCAFDAYAFEATGAGDGGVVDGPQLDRGRCAQPNNTSSACF
jgi:hypothetical protein